MTDSPLAPDLEAWGATFTPASVAPGQVYWKIVEAIGPQDMGGQHHLFVDALDEQGKRMVGETVLFYSQDKEWPTLTESKTGEPQAANLPLYAGGNAYGVKMGDLESDDIFGFGLGSFVLHHSFRVVFRRSIADAQPLPPPVPPADLNGLRVAFLQIRAIADASLKQMETI